MNLQPLYDLKERLDHAAIAGTGLMHEDFRLRRAVEAMAPLAGVNPVFGKIAAGAKSLLDAPADQQSVRLLDVLSLVDAVVYTQGVSTVSGELLPMTPGTGSYVEISYGRLQPLLTALSGSGSGRTSVVRKYFEEHPELFGDFRVLPHVLKALGDNYFEMAELICEILTSQGPDIIPMLKEVFDPAGKGEMVRRVRLIAKLAGAAENDWFAAILPDAKKDVREAVIQSLGLCRDNGQLLLDLCRSERGKMKEAVLRSLAMMEDAACGEVLAQEIRKKPDCVGLLKGVDSEIAAELTAEALQMKLDSLLAENQPYDQTGFETLVMLTNVAVGKYSQRMDELWHWIAGRMESLDAIVPDQSVLGCDMTAAELLQKTFLQTLLANPSQEMLALAHSLAEENRAWFLCGAFLADLAILAPGALFETYSPLIVTQGPLKRESGSERSDRIQIMRGLAAVRWGAQWSRYYVTFRWFDTMTGRELCSARMMDGLDPRWIRLLTDSKICTDGAVFDLSSAGCLKVYPAIDSIISWLIDRENTEVCELAGRWLYRWIWDTCQYDSHSSDLIACGWKDWKGLLVHCVLRQGEVSYYNILERIQQMPVSNAEKAEELKRIELMVQRREVNAKYGRWPHELIAGHIAELEADRGPEI